MSRNGDQAGVEILTGGASHSEAAAIVAAVERFLADTAPAPEPEGPALSPWARAALEEGIAARQVSGYAWGHAPVPVAGPGPSG